MTLLTVSSGGVPVDNYTATFAGVEAQPANPEKGYAPGLRWKFTVEQGPFQGQTASRVTGASPSPKNGCGKILAGLLGRALKEGERIDITQYVGKRYLIVVAPAQGGGTRVEAVVPANPS